MLQKRWYRITLLFLAVILYMVANVIDYCYTINGVSAGISSEGNPVAQDFIKLFGLKKGLQLFKILLVISVIIGASLFEIGYCQKKKRIAPTTISCWILGIGAVLTLLAVGMWIKLLSP